MSDAEYLIQRAQQELQAAMHALDKRVREIHIELADAYTFKLRETTRLERRAALQVELEGQPGSTGIKPAFSW